MKSRRKKKDLTHNSYHSHIYSMGKYIVFVIYLNFKLKITKLHSAKLKRNLNGP